MELENWKIALIAAVIISFLGFAMYFNLSNRRQRVARVYPFPHNPYKDVRMMQKDMRNYTNSKHYGGKHGYGGI